MHAQPVVLPARTPAVLPARTHPSSGAAPPPPGAFTAGAAEVASSGGGGSRLGTGQGWWVSAYAASHATWVRSRDGRTRDRAASTCAAVTSVADIDSRIAASAASRTNAAQSA